MNLRNRSLLVLSLIFFVIFLILAIISFTITLHGLDRIEYTDTHDAVAQVTSSLNAESRALLGTTQDWAWWDDMASFAVDHNVDFINRNANADNLATVKVHLFVILDPEGNLVYGQLLSPDFHQNSSVPDDMMTSVRQNPLLVYHSAPDQGITGTLLTPRGLMVVSSAPILRSDRSGPSRGTLIMGRYLDYGPLQRIESSTGYDVAVLLQNRSGAENTQFTSIESSMSDNFYLSVKNESTVSGYTLARDLGGNPFVIGVTMKRDVYMAGLGNVYTYLVLLLLWAIMTGIIVVVVIDRTVLQRINLLSNRVRHLQDDSSDTPPTILKGNDELSELEHDILMFRANLRMRERELYGFVNAISDPAAMFLPDGTILLANASYAAVLHKTPEDLHNKNIRAFLSEEALTRFTKNMEKVLLNRKSFQNEFELEGKTFFVMYYPILDASENVVRIGLLAFDISDRKRLELALQTVTKKMGLLHAVIFNDIQNQIFVQRGYQDLLRSQVARDSEAKFLEKEIAASNEIQSSLDFARQYNSLGATLPQWQNVDRVMVLAVSHFDLRGLKTEFKLGGLEIYADTLLERVFSNIIENVLTHAQNATTIRAGYTSSGKDVTIFIEDDGHGIPAGEKDQIFNKGAGTRGAVGLFLSREILSITGITIKETGVPGTGARFEITVPEGVYRYSSQV